jgi:hypothetical protein
MPTPRRPFSNWSVYILRCSDGSLYTGITNDLPKRLKGHGPPFGPRLQRAPEVEIGGPEAGGGPRRNG